MITAADITAAARGTWEHELFATGKDSFGARSIFAYLLAADAQHLCRPMDDDYDTVVEPLSRTWARRGQQTSGKLERGPMLSVSPTTDIKAPAIDELRANSHFLTKRGHPDLTPTPHG